MVLAILTSSSLCPMNISTLTLPELGHQLKNKGIFLQTGTFITHLKTAVPGIAEGIKLLYSDYPLIKQADFSDFHVFKPLPADQAFPMLEWGLNWCVSNHVNHYLIIHAAVIEKNGFAAILPAPPGSGKSTLCNNLTKNHDAVVFKTSALLETYLSKNGEIVLQYVFLPLSWRKHTCTWTIR